LEVWRNWDDQCLSFKQRSAKTVDYEELYEIEKKKNKNLSAEIEDLRQQIASLQNEPAPKRKKNN
jgi:cell division protein FtsB